MKKQYTTPAVKAVNIDYSGIICASVGFGEGETNTMGARRDACLDDEEEDY